MKRSMGSLAAATVMALAIGAVGAPAATAADATVMFVQGLPGSGVELCVNNQEFKSNMQYGGKFKKQFGAGSYKIAARTKASGVCKGKLIAKKTVNLSEDESVTIVPTQVKSGPAIRTFNNYEPFLGAVDDSGFLVSHAAKTGAFDAFIAGVIVPAVPSPTLSDIKQGKQRATTGDVGYYSTWLTKKGTTSTVLGPLNKETVLGKANHYVAVGTKSKNQKLVFFRLPLPN